MMKAGKNRSLKRFPGNLELDSDEKTPYVTGAEKNKTR